MIKKRSSHSGQEHPAAGARAAGAEEHRTCWWLRSAVGLRNWSRELQRHPKVSRFPISSSSVPCSVLLAFCNKPGSAVLGGCKSTASCGGPCASCFLMADGDGLAGLLILKQGQLHECLVRAQNESPPHPYRKIPHLSRVGTLTLVMRGYLLVHWEEGGECPERQQSKIKSQTPTDHEIRSKIIKFLKKVFFCSLTYFPFFEIHPILCNKSKKYFPF